MIRRSFWHQTELIMSVKHCHIHICMFDISNSLQINVFLEFFVDVDKTFQFLSI